MINRTKQQISDHTLLKLYKACENADVINIDFEVADYNSAMLHYEACKNFIAMHITDENGRYLQIATDILVAKEFLHNQHAKRKCIKFVHELDALYAKDITGINFIDNKLTSSN